MMNSLLARLKSTFSRTFRIRPRDLAICLSVLLSVISVALAPPLSLAAPMPVPATDTTATQQVMVQQELAKIPRGFYAIKDVGDLRRKIDQKSILLIDVRQPSEYLAGHIDGAINIPLRKLADKIDQIPRDQPVVVYCSSGYRSGMGVMALHIMGYDNVQGFPPSYEGWQQAS